MLYNRYMMRQGKLMDNSTLYGLLDIPEPVIKLLKEYESERTYIISQDEIDKLLDRATWDEALKEIQNNLGEDPYGIKVLWEQLNIACGVYDRYIEKGISEDIFIETMKFCIRFLNEHYHTYGEYKYIMAWWFPRELSMQEFRIGNLEFEIIECDKAISVHIPSDADFTRDAVIESIQGFKKFCETYYEKCTSYRFFCDSWLLSPALANLLDKDSNIIRFQDMFDITEVDYDNPYSLGWVFPGYDSVSDALPEQTRLQKNMKEYLLAGNKVGSAKGFLKPEYMDKPLLSNE